MLEVDEGLEAGDVGVGGGQLGAQPLLLEHTTNILDGLQLIKINELKCMILKPLPTLTYTHKYIYVHTYMYIYIYI